ncbi:hypothetical protein [Pelagibaculum spongiae]|nr:hypothetical protein [Pelagibaculum spongiae]
MKYLLMCLFFLSLQGCSGNQPDESSEIQKKLDLLMVEVVSLRDEVAEN